MNTAKFRRRSREEMESDLNRFRDHASAAMGTFMHDLGERIREIRNRNDEPQMSSKQVVADLERCAELYKKNLLTEEEFSGLKKKLLSQL